MRLWGALIAWLKQKIETLYLRGAETRATNRGMSGPRKVPRTSTVPDEYASALEALPLHHRFPLLLVDSGGLSRSTAARVLSIPRSVLSARLAKALGAPRYLETLRVSDSQRARRRLPTGGSGELG